MIWIYSRFLPQNPRSENSPRDLRISHTNLNLFDCGDFSIRIWLANHCPDQLKTVSNSLLNFHTWPVSLAIIAAVARFCPDLPDFGLVESTENIVHNWPTSKSRAILIATTKPLRFQLRTLLLLTVILAGLFAISRYWPVTEHQSRYYRLIGVASMPVVRDPTIGEWAVRSAVSAVVLLLVTAVIGVVRSENSGSNLTMGLRCRNVVARDSNRKFYSRGECR